jgi:hypothetical protein
MATKAEVEAELAALKEQQAKFIDRVIVIAGEAAVEHDLCHVLEETFAKIGIAVPDVDVQVQRVVTETYRISGFDAYRYGLKGADWTDEEIRNGIDDSIKYGDLPDALQSSEYEVIEVTLSDAA